MWRRQMVANVCAESNEVPLETNYVGTLGSALTRKSASDFAGEYQRRPQRGATVGLCHRPALTAEVKAHVDLVSYKRQ
jgi:hypothetical protein